MIERPIRDSAPHSKWWWLWPFSVIIILIGFIIAVAGAARVLDNTDADLSNSMRNGFLINGLAVSIGGAIVAAVVSLAAEVRTRRENTAAQRHDLFRRMRAAHVKVAIAQQVLSARTDLGTYHEQMLTIQSVVKDLEEIRMEVGVSGTLYDNDDRQSITYGIAQLIMYLHRGTSEYVAAPDRRPTANGTWVVELVDALKGTSVLDPANPQWEPPGDMPAEYDEGLTRSKGLMRAYDYGVPRRERAVLRAAIQTRYPDTTRSLPASRTPPAVAS